MDLEQIQKLFFNAMSQGWANGTPQGIAVNGPLYRQTTPFREGDLFRRDNLALFDCYCMNSVSRKFAGTTVIWYDDEPVWSMSYAGRYEEAAIPCLKKALLEAYRASLFMGGRGPRSFVEGDLEYENTANPNSFIGFSGCEEITNTATRTSLGSCVYSGMSLL